MRNTAALMVAGLLVLSISCGRNEPNYEEQANEALEQASLNEVDANYDDSERVMHVVGTVPTEADRQRAGDLVEQAVNHGARVANEVTVAGGHELIADDLDGGIETRLANLVELDPVLKERSVSFDANNGVVTVTGRVSTAGEKERVEKMARGEPGVRDVVNALEAGIDSK